MERLRTKDPSKLAQQVDNVSSLYGESIVQPSQAGEVYTFPLETLQNDFSTRYTIYVDGLRHLNNNKIMEPSTLERASHTLKALNQLDAYIVRHNEYPENRTLRNRQATVFEDLRRFLERGEKEGREGYVKLPTGSGKTVIFTEFVEATGLKTLIVVPTRPLLHQTVEKFNEFTEDIEVGKIYSHAKETDKDVTVITYDSFVNLTNGGQLSPDDYELLILDEAHRSLSPKRMNTVRKFTNTIKIGFTATPSYSDEKHLGNLLTKEIHSMSVREGVREGILSPFSVFIAKTEADLSNVSVTSLGDYSEKELERAVNIQSRNLAAVNIYEKLFDGRKAVAYCVSVTHAQALASEFAKKGISAGYISGRMTSDEQTSVINDYKQGKIKVLCNADILIEGFDDPEASVCLNLRPTRSPLLAEQRAGRVLRLDKNNPLKQAYIVDFLDKGSNYSQPPITFADVVGDARIVHRGMSFRPDITVRPSRRKPTILVEGIEVTTYTDEVMRIVNGSRIDRKSNPYIADMEATELMELLGEPPSELAATLGVYFKTAHTEEIGNLNKAIASLNQQKGLKNGDGEIPARIVTEVISNALMQRLFLDRNDQYGINATLRMLFTPAFQKVFTFGEIQRPLQRLQKIAEIMSIGNDWKRKAYASQVSRIYFRELGKLYEKTIERGRLRRSLPLTKEQDDAYAQLKKLRIFLHTRFHMYREYRDMIHATMNENPERISQFFQSEDFQSTELEQYIHSQVTKEVETRNANRVVEAISMNETFPLNNFDTGREVVNALADLTKVIPRIRTYRANLLDLLEQWEVIRANGQMLAYTAGFSNEFQNQFTGIHTTLSEYLQQSQGISGYKTGLVPAIASLTSTDRQKVALRNHTYRKIHDHIRDTLQKEDPELVKEFLATFDQGKPIEKTKLFEHLSEYAVKLKNSG